MTQAYQKIMEMKSFDVDEIEQPKIQAQIKNEVDELLGDLNPRYFEESYSCDEAMDKVYSSDIKFSSKFNIFNAF